MIPTSRPRRTLLRAGAALLLAAAAALPALAAYPERTIRIIVPYPPGGTTDLIARIVAAHLSDKLHQAVVVDNRAGAGGVIGAQEVQRAAADGYTLLFGSVASHGILPALQKPPPYDPVKDFAPITLVASTPNVLVANMQAPMKTVAELIAQAKAQPGKIDFGSTSLGGSPHMSGELLKTLAKIDIVHVPYKGGGPMLIDLMGGQIPIGFDNLPSSLNNIRAGKIRALAVTTAKRWPGAPDIPTMAEAGVPGYESSAWFGLLAPAKTPKPIVDQLQHEVAAIIHQPDIEKQFVEQGADAVGNTPEEFATFIAGEMQKWSKVAAATGVKLQ